MKILETHMSLEYAIHVAGSGKMMISVPSPIQVANASLKGKKKRQKKELYIECSL